MRVRCLFRPNRQRILDQICEYALIEKSRQFGRRDSDTDFSLNPHKSTISCVRKTDEAFHFYKTALILTIFYRN